jgi:hypothetical protein
MRGLELSPGKRVPTTSTAYGRIGGRNFSDEDVTQLKPSFVAA